MAMVTLTSPYNANRDEEHHYSGRKKEPEDGEIGVFGAEKYFNGGIDMDSPRSITKIEARKLEYVREGGVKLEPIKPIIHQATPSVRSESSWNSQRALLQSVMRNNPPKLKPNKANGKGFLSSLAGCTYCYCSDENSVETEEVVQVGEISFKRPAKTAASKARLDKVNKPSAETWNKDVDIFTFPTMNSSTMGIRPIKVPLQGDEDEIGRKSLEVFGSPVVGRRSKSLNIERRMKMLSWDATPPKPDIDSESDASSDLFEIESFTSGKANPFLARQASDADCYAPSEASIEWSVVTASAADFSAMSDCDDRRLSTTTLPSPIKTFPKNVIKTTSNKEFQHQRRRSSGLLGCNSQKAVKVAGDAYRVSNDKASFDPRMRRVSDSYIPATRFRAETNLASFEPAQTPRIIAARSLPHSHSPKANSHLLYIQ